VHPVVVVPAQTRVTGSPTQAPPEKPQVPASAPPVHPKVTVAPGVQVYVAATRNPQSFSPVVEVVVHAVVMFTGGVVVQLVGEVTKSAQVEPERARQLLVVRHQPHAVFSAHAPQLVAVHVVGQAPQSPGQVVQVSELAHMPSPQRAGQGPQSPGQVVQVSPLPHMPSPQEGPTGTSGGGVTMSGPGASSPELTAVSGASPPSPLRGASMPAGTSLGAPLSTALFASSELPASGVTKAPPPPPPERAVQPGESASASRKAGGR
jgi:hypothetical protein